MEKIIQSYSECTFLFFKRVGVKLRKLRSLCRSIHFERTAYVIQLYDMDVIRNVTGANLLNVTLYITLSRKKSSFRENDVRSPLPLADLDVVCNSLTTLTPYCLTSDTPPESSRHPESNRDSNFLF